MEEQTKKCPKCKEEIKIDAKKCKHCNADLRSWPERHKVLTFILCLVFLITIINIFAGTDSSQKKNSSSYNYITQKTQLIKIDAEKLWEEYEDNEVLADSKYKNKQLQVTGIVVRIENDLFGNPYIVLEGYPGSTVMGIKCEFDSSYESKISNLEKGEEVTVIGLNRGDMINILLKNCQF